MIKSARINNIKTIASKELNSYFNSATAYVIITVFLALVGWFYVNNIFLIDTATMLPMFEQIIPLIFLFIIPALTMRLFSEEKKTGTIELLATKPIRDIDIILGKFFAAWTLVGIMLLPTFLYWGSIAAISDIDHGPVIGGYLGLMLMAAVFISAGLLASSLTENQVVAFIIGLVFILLLYFLDKVLIYFPAWAASTIEYFGIDFHYANIARGVIDTRNLIYFASAFSLFIYLTLLSLERRKW